MTKWLPAGNKVLVKCDPVAKTFNPGGRIEVPAGTVIEREEMRQMLGTVIAMGPMAYKDQAVDWVQVGDRVKFTKYAGFIHEEEGDTVTKYRVMHDLDIIMVFKGDE